MKLFAALGPGDIVAAHRAQMRGEAVLSETSIIFSGQLFEYCRERGIETLALSRHPRTDCLSDGTLRLENRPRWFEYAGGVSYHLGNIAYAFYLATRARLFGADLAIIDFGSAHAFALTLLRLLGIRVALNFHNTLWPAGHPPQASTARLLLRLDAYFLRRIAVAVMGISPECGRQVKQLAGRALPYFEYRAQFRREGFDLQRREHGLDPFRVAFIGRVEASKGALDIPLIAEQILERSSRSIVFEVCGDGGALPALENACPRLAQQFYDRSQSYPAAVDRLLAGTFPSWKPSASYEPLFDRIPRPAPQRNDGRS
jgi:hypothetical protein